MNNLNSICFICLNDNNNLKPVLQTGIQNDTAIQVQYVLPEITILDSIYICSLCCTSLHSFYTFKKKCLKNYNRLLNNTNTLQVISDQNCTKLQIQPLVKLEQDVDIEVNITEECEDLSQNVEGNSEEMSAFEDDALPDGYQQLEFVKCELLSDCEQEVIISEENNPFDEKDNKNSGISINSDLPKQTKLNKRIRKFECSVCNKKFIHKSQLDAHMKSHIGIKDFQCTICDKKFVLKDHLRTHMKFHSGVRDFQCAICDKKFILNAHLQTHIKIHSGLKDFECSLCNKRFALKSYLQRHMRFHVDFEEFQCSVCLKKFRQKYRLKMHIMKKHKC